MSLRITLLGTGSSGGVPRVGNNWGACDPSNPKNRRLRCSALIELYAKGAKTVVLIDTSPDLREQLLSRRVDQIDGVLYTHDHADHTHGIDDLRGIAFAMRRRVDVHADASTRTTLEQRFGYCFTTPPGGSYPPILNLHDIHPGRPITISGPAGSIELLPILQEHGDIASLAFRVGNMAYSPDVSGLSPSAVDALANLDVWIVDALRYVPHPSHFSVKEALQWIDQIAPKRAILTHLHVDLDYAALKRELPPHVEPAFDGLQIEF
jgi:phosphoribosyl 1,2-cyclic phosphate phosphodiesterase